MPRSTGLLVEEGRVMLTNVITTGNRKRRSPIQGGSISEHKLVERMGQLSGPPKDFCPIPQGVHFFDWVDENSGVLVVEVDPAIHTFTKWIEDIPESDSDDAGGSPTQSIIHLGEGANYKSRVLAHPYIVLVLPFYQKMLQSGKCQVFYRQEPLVSWDDPLLMTNLLNVAEGYGFTNWLCLQYYQHKKGLSWQDAVEDVVRYFYWSGFNRSSEIHERNSHYGTIVRRGIDERVSSVERWEEETLANPGDPGFMLEIPWPETGHTVYSAVELSRRSIRLHIPSLVNVVQDLRSTNDID